jgi:GPI mannosyltransferase 3
MNKITNRFVLAIALAWYICTAWFSIGYYHADEHYQIIEFSGIKTGQATGADLAWEFKSQIRSSVQPAFCYVIFKLCSFSSIQDPYLKAFILRLITGLLAVFSIYYFTNACRHLVLPKYQLYFFVTSFFIWFLPFLDVRFSSETWSGLLLLLSVAIVLKENKKTHHYFLIGFLWGLSFLFRFQISFALAGLLLWLVFVKNERFKNIIALSLASTTVILLGTLLDFWFYHNFVFTPLRYFKVNVIEGGADSFGTSPWYYYLHYIFRLSFFPFGILIISSFAFLICRKPASIFVWIILPFLVIHSFIPHKEPRFLFPVINFIPVIFFLAIQEIKITRHKDIYVKCISVLITLLLIINLAGLITSSFKPAGFGRMSITKTIHELKYSRQVNLICFEGSNPYDPWNGRNGPVARFYLDPGISFKNLSSVDQLNPNQFEPQKLNMMVIKNKYIQSKEIQDIIARQGLKKVTQSIPPFFIPFLKIYGGSRTLDEILILYSE